MTGLRRAVAGRRRTRRRLTVLVVSANLRDSNMTTKAQCRATSVALAVMAVTAALAISSAPVGQTMQPNQISHLGLWLSASDLAKEYADGRPVTRWPDRSGKGYDAVFEGR